jgi:hypothetical protein
LNSEISETSDPSPKKPETRSGFFKILVIAVTAGLFLIALPKIIKSLRSNGEAQKMQQSGGSEEEATVIAKSLAGKYVCITEGLEYRFTETMELIDTSYATYFLDVEGIHSDIQILANNSRSGRIFEKIGPFKIDQSHLLVDLTTEFDQLSAMRLVFSSGDKLIPPEGPDISSPLVRLINDYRAYMVPPVLDAGSSEGQLTLLGLLLDQLKKSYTFPSPLKIQLRPDDCIRLPNKHILRREDVNAYHRGRRSVGKGSSG